MGIDANYLYLELAFDKYTCFRRFTYWQHTPNFWLNFAIEGDTEENYAESEFVMSGIKKLQINPFSIPVPLVASAVKI